MRPDTWMASELVSWIQSCLPSPESEAKKSARKKRRRARKAAPGTLTSCKTRIAAKAKNSCQKAEEVNRHRKESEDSCLRGKEVWDLAQGEVAGLGCLPLCEHAPLCSLSFLLVYGICVTLSQCCCWGRRRRRVKGTVQFASAVLFLSWEHGNTESLWLEETCKILKSRC